jgi:hypothetical protein
VAFYKFYYSPYLGISGVTHFQIALMVASGVIVPIIFSGNISNYL